MITFSKNFGDYFIMLHILLAACNDKSATNNEQKIQGRITIKITVVTTIAQIGEPLSVIGGDRVEVKV